MTEQNDVDLTFLEYVYRASLTQPGGVADLAGVHELIGEQESNTTASGLRDQGLIRDENRLSGGYHITAEGRRVVEEMLARRSDRGLRRFACRPALLRWLDNRDAIDPASRVARDEFDASLDLVPFTPVEATAAAEFLRSKRLIEGIDLGEEDNVLIWITNLGQECIDSGLEPGDFIIRQTGTAPAQVVNQHIAGNVHSNAIGDHATATTNVNGIDIEAIRKIAALVRQAEGTLDLPPEAEPVLVQIETSADPTIVQRALGQLVLLANGTAAGLIAALAAPHLGGQ